MASPLELFAHATQFFGQKVVLLGRFNGQVSLPSCFPAVLPSYFPTFLPFLLLRPLVLVQDGHLHLQTPRNPFAQRTCDHLRHMWPFASGLNARVFCGAEMLRLSL